MPSLANQQKAFGETQKSHYQRTGVASANNPLAATSNNYYQNFHGKKIEEIEKEPEIAPPKYLQYHLQRITQKCTQRGERGLFGLKRLFHTYDYNQNGVLEYKEFERALIDFKLDLEEHDIKTLFRTFD